MRTLPKKFNGPKRDDLQDIEFTQIKNEGRIYMYHRSDGEYEVITAKLQKEHTSTIKGEEIFYEAKHVYPSGNDWNEFHTRNYDKAVEEFNKLTA